MDMSWKLTVKMGLRVIAGDVVFRKTQKYTEYFENRQTLHLII